MRSRFYCSTQRSAQVSTNAQLFLRNRSFLVNLFFLFFFYSGYRCSLSSSGGVVAAGCSVWGIWSGMHPTPPHPFRGNQAYPARLFTPMKDPCCLSDRRVFQCSLLMNCWNCCVCVGLLRSTTEFSVSRGKYVNKYPFLATVAAALSAQGGFFRHLELASRQTFSTVRGRRRGKIVFYVCTCRERRRDYTQMESASRRETSEVISSRGLEPSTSSCDVLYTFSH